MIDEYQITYLSFKNARELETIFSYIYLFHFNRFSEIEIDNTKNTWTVMSTKKPSEPTRNVASCRRESSRVTHQKMSPQVEELSKWRQVKNCMKRDFKDFIWNEKIV